MSVPKCLFFFQDLEGLTEFFDQMFAGMSGPKPPLWAAFSFLSEVVVQMSCTRGDGQEPHGQHKRDALKKKWKNGNARGKGDGREKGRRGKCQSGRKHCLPIVRALAPLLLVQRCEHHIG